MIPVRSQWGRYNLPRSCGHHLHVLHAIHQTLRREQGGHRHATQLVQGQLGMADACWERLGKLGKEQETHWKRDLDISWYIHDISRFIMTNAGVEKYVDLLGRSCRNCFMAWSMMSSFFVHSQECECHGLKSWGNHGPKLHQNHTQSSWHASF